MSECEDCYADLHCDNCPCCESAPKAWRYPCYCLPGAARCDDPTACDRSIQESAGCELRPALIEDVKTALDAAYHYSSYRWPQQQDCHRIADDLLAGAALRDVLAAAARDAEKVGTLESQNAALQRLVEDLTAGLNRELASTRRVRELANEWGVEADAQDRIGGDYEQAGFPDTGKLRHDAADELRGAVNDLRDALDGAS